MKAASTFLTLAMLFVGSMGLAEQKIVSKANQEAKQNAGEMTVMVISDDGKSVQAYAVDKMHPDIVSGAVKKMSQENQAKVMAEQKMDAVKNGKSMGDAMPITAAEAKAMVEEAKKDASTPHWWGRAFNRGWFGGWNNCYQTCFNFCPPVYYQPICYIPTFNYCYGGFGIGCCW